jgi:hypothetical protein
MTILNFFIKYLPTRFHFLFYFLVFATLLDRFHSLYIFGFRVIDDDQAVMWNAANEFSRGNFYVPRFFGQAYNTHFEALMAVPLYILGMPLNYCLPLITSLMTLIPFYIIAILAFKHKQYHTSLIILAWLLVSPIEFSMITSMPRGFVPGVFVSSIALILLLPSFLSKKSPSQSVVFTSGFLGFLGFSLNPNAIFLFIFIVFLNLYFFYSERNYRSLIAVCLGMVISYFIHLSTNIFYYNHPDYILHRLKPLRWRYDNFAKNINRLDDIFGYFAFESLPLFICICLFFIIILINYINAKKYFLLYVWLILGLIVILSLGFNKVGDGANDIYIPLARMYLALPPLFAINLLISFSQQDYQKYRRLYYSVVIVICFITINVFIYRQLGFQSMHSKHARTQSTQVKAMWVNNVYTECKYLDHLTDKYQTKLVIFSEFANSKILNYSCPIFFDHKFSTIFPQLERRWWRIEEEQNIERVSFLLYKFPTLRRLVKHKQVLDINLIDKEADIYYIRTKLVNIVDLLKESNFVFNMGSRRKRFKLL